ncbi:hypothetical protein DFH08DRAFT_1085129 [Mycena albidolilacea]|uniref:Uncharacterized protein n=1 Tax=Mycena albidolilacea TaxID=1033008 RepID=A0AAD6ZJP4_9AGAR|nr:hypothetical protein DFH08DRAFT_1085129 [Mycena albidolilacea]
MSLPHFRSTSSQLHPDSDENVPMRDRDSAESLLHSAVELLKMSREAPKPRRFNSSRALQVLSLVLHLLLVGIHLALLAIWARGLEHRITFSQDNQKSVNFRITAIANTFGAIYAAALVFVTQRLWTRQSLRADQTLTATHDSAAAWTGIGSALSQLWTQRTTSGSDIGVLSVFLYLANILVLHITTPALFSFETFNSTRPFPVATRSLPSLNSFSQVNWSDPDNISTATLNLMQSDYVKGSLYFLPSILGSNTSLGLKDGTLYDVVDINSGVGNVTVDATGFNITCGYLTVINITHSQSTKDRLEYWSMDFREPYPHWLFPTQRGIICPLLSIASPIVNFNYVDFYSTTPIMDSNNYLSEVKLNPPMNTFADPVSSVQFFWCSQSLVNQKAVVDAQTRQILAVELGSCPAVRCRNDEQAVALPPPPSASTYRPPPPLLGPPPSTNKDLLSAISMFQRRAGRCYSYCTAAHLAAPSWPALQRRSLRGLPWAQTSPPPNIAAARRLAALPRLITRAESPPHDTGTAPHRAPPPPPPLPPSYCGNSPLPAPPPPRFVLIFSSRGGLKYAETSEAQSFPPPPPPPAPPPRMSAPPPPRASLGDTPPPAKPQPHAQQRAAPNRCKEIVSTCPNSIPIPDSKLPI